MYINLLNMLASFRNADISNIKWHDQTSTEHPYIKFTVCDSGEYCEYTLLCIDNNHIEVLRADLPR